MKDRISTYPGRVRLIPVEGQENVFDLTRADEPIQEGTPLNKNSLLKDATAALFGMTDYALPDEVFAAIATMLIGKPGIETGSYVGTGNAGQSYPNSLTFDFKPKILIIQHETLSDMNQLEGYDNWPKGINWVFFIEGVNQVLVRQGTSNSSNTNLIITRDGNTISWYHDYTTPFSSSQLNYGSAVYRYLAIG